MTIACSQLGHSYVQAYKDMCLAIQGNSNFARKPLSLCWPFIGSGYSAAPKRLLIVGKAMNGNHENTRIPSSSEQLDSVLDWCITDREERDGNKSNCEEWLATSDGAKARRSPFWQLASKAFEVVTDDTRPNWWKRVAWTNLYKVSPEAPESWATSVPAEWLQQMQHEAAADGTPGHAQKLLRMEIDLLRPDIVVCITGHEWMHHFWHAPSHNPLGLQWQSVGENWWRDPVHKIAKEDTPTGTRTWIVTQRPEFRKLAPLIEAIRHAVS